MGKKQSSSGTVIKYIVSIIILANIMISVMPGLIDSLSYYFGGSGQNEDYSDIHISDAVAQIVPESSGLTAEEGYLMYRFDVTVDNKGNRDEKIQYTPFFMDSQDGEVVMQEELQMSDGVQDTRMFAQGRSCVYSIYAKVSTGTTSVDIYTYRTSDGEQRTFNCILPLPEENNEI